MTLPRHYLYCKPALLVAALLAFARPAAAGTPGGDSGTNAPAAAAAIPQPKFDVTSSPVKDPFFPHTARSPVPVLVASASPAPVGYTASSFQLKGLSARLATINNRVLAAGEDAEVTTATGRVKIHCVEIKEDSVVISAGGQPTLIELHLRRGV